ncbi:hypothetical protein FRC09_004752 [Ceratobasidium sp. 395]|nr:hypothetical protein FRC09_004752 [Ceratobasidium sp. 395]
MDSSAQLNASSSHQPTPSANQHDLKHAILIKKPDFAQHSLSNEEPTAAGQATTQGIVTDTSIAENTQDPAQGIDQIANHPTQPVLPVAVVVAVTDMPDALLVAPAPPPVQAPEPGPDFMVIAPNGEPAQAPLLRTLYGSPHVIMGTGHVEDGQDQDEDNEA